MADSISFQWTVAVSQPPFTDAVSRSMSLAPSGRGVFSQMYTLASDHTESVLTISGISENGLAILENVGQSSDAQEILVGPESSGAMVACLRIRQGEAYAVRLVGSGLTLRAATASGETAAGKLRFTVREN